MTAVASDAILERLMTLHPKKIDLTLERMQRLLAALGHPERKLPSVVLIAGTNGKGSTQAMVRAGLEADGLTVHAYTSPHLAWFRERIYLAGRNIDEQAFADLLEECEALNAGVPITFFEITTAAAFLAFARHPADYLMLEVGLGGRLDATNVVDRPAACVITPVSLDHQQFLGETIAEIAAEKAGILKPGVTCVVNRQTDAALEVIEAQAERVGAPLLVAGRDWDVWTEHGRLVFQDLSGLLDLPMPNLIGVHQIGNAGAAIATLRHLRRGVPEAAVSRADWPARIQRLKTGPLAERAAGLELWLDGGHNQAAGEALAQTFAEMPECPLHLICGMLESKDSGGFLGPFEGLVQSVSTVSIPGEGASLSAEALATSAKAVGLKAAPVAGLETALSDLARKAPGARVLICGSLYLAGYVLRQNGS